MTKVDYIFIFIWVIILLFIIWYVIVSVWIIPIYYKRLRSRVMFEKALWNNKKTFKKLPFIMHKIIIQKKFYSEIEDKKNSGKQTFNVDNLNLIRYIKNINKYKNLFLDDQNLLIKDIDEFKAHLDSERYLALFYWNEKIRNMEVKYYILFEDLKDKKKNIDDIKNNIFLKTKTLQSLYLLWWNGSKELKRQISCLSKAKANELKIVSQSVGKLTRIEKKNFDINYSSNNLKKIEKELKFWLKWTKEVKVELDYGKNHLWRHNYNLKCLRRIFENGYVKLKRLKIAIYYEEELELERVKEKEKEEKEKY